MAIQQLSDGNPLGVSLGQSGDLISFFGGTGTAQPASTAAIASTASCSISATQWAFSTSAQATGIVTLLGAIHANLKSLNLIAS